MFRERLRAVRTIARVLAPVVVVVSGAAYLSATARAYADAPRSPYAPVSGATASVHDPFDSETCSACHETDDVASPGAVKDASAALCLECHDDPMAQAGEGAHAHNPARGRCIDCHNPHNASQGALLHDPVAVLCTRCHSDVAKAMTGPTTHGALARPGACIICHEPHASTRGALLRDDATALCTTCHTSDALKDDEGRALANVGELARSSAHPHGAMDVDGCVTCHTPHGGERHRMLKGAYPSTFYAPFSPEAYGLCFECHEAALVVDVNTRSATQFRDGTRNLHTVHVARGDRGRSCSACHSVHGASLPHGVAERVPYGSRGYKLELHFSVDENGGSCAKTCHMEKRYDRTRP